MPFFRSVPLVLVLLVFAACPAVAVAQDHPGDADPAGYDPGYDDSGSDDGVDYDDPGYADDGSQDDADYGDDAGYGDQDCVTAYLEDPELDGHDNCQEGTDTGIDVPELDPLQPGVPTAPAGPVLVHLHANGRVWASPKLPRRVRQVISAANRIATKPYRYGGGHGTWTDRAYDCSGSVSFALHGAGLLNATLTSGGLAHWGAKGKGKWITIFANAGHTYMVVAGMRFDTGARPRSGTRWDPWQRPARGFAVRHPAGL